MALARSLLTTTADRRQAIADPTTSDEAMADHQRVVDADGYGVPTLFFPDGQCLFGPVLNDPPVGETGRCGCGTSSSRGRSFGISTSCRGPKTPAEHTIAETFGHYLEAAPGCRSTGTKVVAFDTPRRGCADGGA